MDTKIERIFRSWKGKFRMWRERRSLQRQINAAVRKTFADSRAGQETLTFEELHHEIQPLKNRLASLKTYRLHVKAARAGIDIPHYSDWWTVVPAEDEHDFERRYLTLGGQYEAAKLIREAKLKNTERWIRILAPLVAALTGLVGTIIGLVALLRSK